MALEKSLPSSSHPSAKAKYHFVREVNRSFAEPEGTTIVVHGYASAKERKAGGHPLDVTVLRAPNGELPDVFDRQQAYAWLKKDERYAGAKDV